MPLTFDFLNNDTPATGRLIPVLSSITVFFLDEFAKVLCKIQKIK